MTRRKLQVTLLNLESEERLIKDPSRCTHVKSRIYAYEFVGYLQHATLVIWISKRG